MLLAGLAIQGLAFIGESSQTSDEGAHLAAGYSYLKTGDFRLNVEHPPLLKEIAALPLLPFDLSFPWGPLWDHAEEWNIGRIFLHENRLRNDTLLFLARLPMLLLSLLLGWALFLWGRTLHGARGALLALSLYVLDPNVVAHSCLVTTDLGVTLFLFLAIQALWAWARGPSPRRLLLFGLTAGAAFASKFTAIWLLPMLAILGAFFVIDGVPLPARPWSRRSRLVGPEAAWPRRAALLLCAGIAAGLAALAVLALSYGIAGLPAFFKGLLIGFRHSGQGHTGYLMGTLSESGWWYYFLFAYLVKTPIGTLAIVLVAIALGAAGRRIGRRDEIVLWTPVVVTLAITCLWKVNIGLRHLLPIYPFLYLAAGRIAPRGAVFGASGATAGAARTGDRVVGVFVALCLTWNAIEAFRITPYHLAYFNPLAGGPDQGHRYLLDSNLDWGQSSRALRRAMGDWRTPVIFCGFAGNSDPWYYGVAYQYVPGSGNLETAKTRPTRVPDGLPREILAISPMVLHGVHFTDHNLYGWLKEHRPIARPGHTWMVYDITGDAEAHAWLAVVSINFGLLDLAGDQARRTLRIDPRSELALAVLEKLKEEAEKGSRPAPPAATRD